MTLSSYVVHAKFLVGLFYNGCIFHAVFGCCALQMLVEICYFNFWLLFARFWCKHDANEAKRVFVLYKTTYQAPQKTGKNTLHCTKRTQNKIKIVQGDYYFVKICKNVKMCSTQNLVKIYNKQWMIWEFFKDIQVSARTQDWLALVSRLL